LFRFFAGGTCGGFVQNSDPDTSIWRARIARLIAQNCAEDSERFREQAAGQENQQKETKVFSNQLQPLFPSLLRSVEVFLHASNFRAARHPGSRPMRGQRL
jgi:hypothetical protein